MKRLFVLVICLVLAACSSEPELAIEQFQDGTLKGFSGKLGAENRYGIDKHIYLYMAYDRQSILDDNPPSSGCVIKVFNLAEDSILTTLPEDRLLHYLNYLDTPSSLDWINRTSGEPIYFSLSGHSTQSIDSIWLKQAELPADFFNPFNVDLAKLYQDDSIRESPSKTHLDECLQFFYDGAEKQTYTQKYHLNFMEKYREEMPEQYIKPDFEAVLKDPDSLIKASLGCSSSGILFLNVKRKLIVSVGYGRHKYPNPSCP